jgi:hypothetical protein
MPLKQSDTDAATEDNFSDWRSGKTFKKTDAKYGKRKAQKQMVAVVLKNKRKAAGRKRSRKRS